MIYKGINSPATTFKHKLIEGCREDLWIYGLIYRHVALLSRLFSCLTFGEERCVHHDREMTVDKNSSEGFLTCIYGHNQSQP